MVNFPLTDTIMPPDKSSCYYSSQNAIKLGFVVAAKSVVPIGSPVEHFYLVISVTFTILW